MNTTSHNPAPMWRLALIASRRLFCLIGSARPTSLRGSVVLLLALPVFALLQLINWCGLLLDELCFPRWRNTPICKPLFVLGVPRSGTTFLHRVLADSDDFTTFRLWECLFAPSISQRVFWSALARLDRRIGAPGARALDLLQSRVLGRLDDIHSTRLTDAEEDYLALLPYLGAFILILPFPQAKLTWQLATADRDMPAHEREYLMAFYEALIRKHLYFHGDTRRYLSKNAAFAGLAGSLAARFPDAVFIACLREPERALPSQLSSIREGALLFHSKRTWERLYLAQFLEVFPFFYSNLHAGLTRRAPSRHVFLSMKDLQASLDVRLPEALAYLGVTLTPSLKQAIATHAEASRQYRSAHKVDTSGLAGIEEMDLQHHFAREVPALPYLLNVIHRNAAARGVLACS